MPPIQSLTHAQIQPFLTALSHPHWQGTLRGNLHRNLTLALLMLDAGLRVGETVKLSRHDLRLSIATLTTLVVRDAVAKTHVPRQIPLTIRLVDAIEKYLDSTAWPDAVADNPWAFPTFNPTNHITTRQVQKIIAHAGLRALNFTVTPHILRHTFATRLMRTTSTRIVQDLLGHKCLASTQIYTHPNAGDLRKAIDKLDPQLPMNLQNTCPPKSQGV